MLVTIRTLLCFVAIPLCVSCTSIQPVHFDVSHSSQPIGVAEANDDVASEWTQ